MVLQTATININIRLSIHSLTLLVWTLVKAVLLLRWITNPLLDVKHIDSFLHVLGRRQDNIRLETGRQHYCARACFPICVALESSKSSRGGYSPYRIPLERKSKILHPNTRCQWSSWPLERQRSMLHFVARSHQVAVDLDSKIWLEHRSRNHVY